MKSWIAHSLPPNQQYHQEVNGERIETFDPEMLVMGNTHYKHAHCQM